VSEKLPTSVLLKLEQTLAQWEHWRGSGELPGAPHVVSVLTGGVSNYNILAEAAGLQFAVRIDGVNPAANGLNRQAEWRILHAAHQAGIAPRPRYFNPELGSLVCDYLAGYTLAGTRLPGKDLPANTLSGKVAPGGEIPADKKADPDIPDLALLLRRIHALPALHYRLDMHDRIKRYQRHLETASPEQGGHLESLRHAEQRIIAIAAGTPRYRVCHNDLTPANLVVSGKRLYALDWEYCAMGNPWFDLAVLADGLDMDQATSDQVIEHYLERPVNEHDRISLRQQTCVYRYLEILWYLSQKPSCLDTASLEKRLALLSAGLEQLPADSNR